MHPISWFSALVSILLFLAILPQPHYSGCSQFLSNCQVSESQLWCPMRNIQTQFMLLLILVPWD